MKRIILFSLVLLITGTSFSQTFMHGVGTGSFGILLNNKETGDMDSGIYGVFSYSPRVSFLEGDNTSLSVGIPVTVGIGGSYSYSYSSYYGNSESNTLIYMVSAPVILDFNFGAGAHKETEKRFGGFIGGGAGIFHGTISTKFYDINYYDYYQRNTTVTTPVLAGNAGFRIAVGRNQKNIETKLTYMKGLNERKPDIFGLGVAFNF
jgi:hypothetical protein